MHIESYKSKGRRYYRIREGNLIVRHLGSAQKVDKVFASFDKMINAIPIKESKQPLRLASNLPEIPESEDLSWLDDDENDL